MTGILSSIRKEGRLELTELDSKRVLAAWGVPVNRTELARDLSEAVKVAREIRYPLVLKIASPDIIHKNEAKGVKVGLTSELELRQSFGELIDNVHAYKPDAKILGVTIQEYLPPAREVIVGALQDPSFGATVMFGLAGVWAEVLKDISFRLAPLNAEDAREMIQEIKGYPVLAGIQRAPPADINALVDIIQKVGQLAHEFPEITEINLNPIFAFDDGKGAVTADARIVLGRGK
ncbi:MAG: acetyl-CoA synthetase [Hadesarchaea archaeon]|nr:acetyl-CoA synthetase [Hadesarchaea archaeon]TES83579.1 MAG: acetyl-CoA synthetase [Hadesarchaea archaeon]